ncbi:hypothetical protein P3G55_13235 [Leptospira sp. 96542]|nr:hypothetical protein [Leptospira sp. 96542]
MPFQQFHLKLYIFSIFIISSLFYGHEIDAKTWNDLETEKDVEIYGSERNLKFTSSNLLYDIENWKDHYSVRAFGFYRYYDYPKFKSKTIFPIYYHTKSKLDNREYKRVINYNSTIEKDNIDKSIFPFVFWGENKNKSYQTVFPFYFYDNHKNYNKFGFPILPIIYYHNREETTYNEENYTRLLTLLQYGNNRKQGLSSVSVFPVLYWKKDNYLFLPFFLYYQEYNQNYTNFWLGPVYYNKSNVDKTSFVFPIYGAHTSSKVEWDFIFPLYLNYNNKIDDYHINLLWYTKSNSANVDLVTNDGNLYLDFDFGIFYNLFSFSNRTKILNVLPQSNETNENKKSTVPQITKKREFNRENSDSFTGYSALFGIFSYERADTKRHIRLLPLAWFTWDKESEDGLVILPPFLPLYLSYKSDDLEYKVIFPIYGKQKDEKSEFRAYLLNVYLTEDVKEYNHKENDYFWPFVNTYSSDIKLGHRVLPFYIYNKILNPSQNVSKTYTLFSRYENRKTQSTNTSNLFIWPLWILYSNYTNELKSEFNTRYWITPFYYHAYTPHKTRTNFLWFTDWELNLVSNVNTGEKESKLSHLLIFPFYKSESHFSIIPLSFNGWTENSFTTFTFLQYLELNKSGHYYNFLYLIESENTSNGYMFRSLGDVLWSFRTNKTEVNRASVLWLGYDNQSASKKIINFFPLFRTADSYNETSKMIGPFLYYKNESLQDVTELALFGIGYLHHKEKVSNQYGTYLLLGALYQEKTEEARGFLKRGSLWGWLWEYQSEDTGYEKFSILKLFSYTKDTDGSRKILGISI